MEITEDIAMRALHLYAQGMTAEFVGKKLYLSGHSVRDASRYLRDHFETATLGGAVGAAFRRGIWKPLGWELSPNVSPRRLEALDLASRGLMDEFIAEKMGLTRLTAANHIKHAVNVLDAKNRTHAIWKAFNWGVLIP